MYICMLPRHPHQHMQKKRNELLLKNVKTSSGKKMFSALSSLLLRKYIDSIEDVIQQPGMLDLFNHWKDRNVPNDVMSDVYVGAVWHGQELLTSRYCLGLVINMDWFKSYKHIEGAIYISILNLPHQLRYRLDNTTVIGVTPGPHEPKLHMNSYVKSLLTDLLKVWKGI